MVETERKVSNCVLHVEYQQFRDKTMERMAKYVSYDQYQVMREEIQPLSTLPSKVSIIEETVDKPQVVETPPVVLTRGCSRKGAGRIRRPYLWTLLVHSCCSLLEVCGWLLLFPVPCGTTLVHYWRLFGAYFLFFLPAQQVQQFH